MIKTREDENSLDYIHSVNKKLEICNMVDWWF